MTAETTPTKDAHMTITNATDDNFLQHTYDLTISIKGVTFVRTLSEFILEDPERLQEIMTDLVEDIVTHMDHLNRNR